MFNGIQEESMLVIKWQDIITEALSGRHERL